MYLHIIIYLHVNELKKIRAYKHSTCIFFFLLYGTLSFHVTFLNKKNQNLLCGDDIENVHIPRYQKIIFVLLYMMFVIVFYITKCMYLFLNSSRHREMSYLIYFSHRHALWHLFQISYLFIICNIRTHLNCLHCLYINKKSSSDHIQQCIRETVHPDQKCGYSCCQSLQSRYDSGCQL